MHGVTAPRVIAFGEILKVSVSKGSNFNDLMMAALPKKISDITQISSTGELEVCAVSPDTSDARKVQSSVIM